MNGVGTNDEKRKATDSPVGLKTSKKKKEDKEEEDKEKEGNEKEGNEKEDKEEDKEEEDKEKKEEKNRKPSSWGPGIVMPPDDQIPIGWGSLKDLATKK